MAFDFEAVGRVLRAVEGAGLAVSADFEPSRKDHGRLARERRAELGGSIASAFDWSGMEADLTSSARARSRYDRLAKVADLARRLAELVEDDGNPLTLSLAPHFTAKADPSGIHEAMDGIKALRSAAEAERRRLRADGLHDRAVFAPRPGANAPQPTAGDRLMLDLAETFRQFFGAEPRVLYDDAREPCGPWVAFVMAVREEAGDPSSSAGVRKAWDRARDRDSEIA